jgi:FtsP/CotA-like multicopper oxidase with cupredoxin domain
MDRRLSRRETLKLSAVGAGSVLVPGGLGVRSLGRMFRHLQEPKAFSLPLARPRVARPVRRTLTTDYYHMTIREAEAEILPGTKTKILGYDGEFPGPTIRAIKGRRVVIRQANALDMDAAVHLHGGHVAPSNDGHPANFIAPGATRDYEYPNDQPGATLWYHDHVHHMEAEMVFRGLAGCYLIDDPMERRLGLPGGSYDVPIILRDIRLDDAGQIVWEMGDFENRNTILVNGRPQPYLRVAARKYRLRLINGANMRFMSLELSTGAEMTIVASDGGLLPAPQPAKNIMLSAGERVDVVVDFGTYPPGTQVVLVNAFGDSEKTQNIMRFDVGSPVADRSRVPKRLAPARHLGSAEVTRDVVFGFDPAIQEFLIDGKTFDMDRVDTKIKRGETEIWQIQNKGANPPIPHNIHLHGTHFEVLDRDGQPPGPHEIGPKDTVYVGPGSTVRIKVRYDHYLGRYLYHCHLLDHSSMGMMAQAEIVD